ncbi:tRNA uridine-5-carboxymethylaminomethyl(34) synthesis GTPase MnmE [Alkalilacustris brevis]|uniref:tRNA uridine-5-carboxymethylaminomethyl(34) synthesis GTPase MnmE n=1 Tax=Alkalilacustris brevis TaxID=2026338 RepID=UPI000E0DAF47|nr:tRNA uridine-5-carboxymethylaminomethyl(34) synthesis GTPase MnmE [Alkalilacustris brevis]
MTGGGADTIFALTTTRGKSGVAVIRLSGPRAWTTVEALCGPLPAARHASLRTLRNVAGEPLDQGLVLLFEAGASFTGEDIGELHLHGSLAVIDAVLDELGGIAGLRPAQAGEFTRRALENDCLDLAEVEGLSDLIEAETEAQRKQAYRVLTGAIGKMVEGWRGSLVRALALLEATIDFADEDVPSDVMPEVQGLIASVLPELRAQIAGAKASERLREGFEVAIIGPPNIGKSTLLNLLAGREAAITSEIAGTTRDVIEVRMDISGIPVTLLDTAGLRETTDAVEQVGVSRAVERARAADMRIFLVSEHVEEIMAVHPQADDLVVFGKGDLAERPGMSISAVTGEGVDALIEAIRARLEKRVTGASAVIRARQRIAVERAVKYLEDARRELAFGQARADLAAEELRGALHSLDVLVGRVDVEHVLDEIFSSFCIGK